MVSGRPNRIGTIGNPNKNEVPEHSGTSVSVVEIDSVSYFHPRRLSNGSTLGSRPRKRR